MKAQKPSFLKKYFWDIKFEDLDPQKRSRYTIERLLEYGDEKAVRWMFKNFSEEAIKEALVSSRQLSLKSANFWAMYMGIDKEKVLCLSKPFREIRKKFWPY